MARKYNANIVVKHRMAYKNDAENVLTTANKISAQKKLNSKVEFNWRIYLLNSIHIDHGKKTGRLHQAIRLHFFKYSYTYFFLCVYTHWVVWHLNVVVTFAINSCPHHMEMRCVTWNQPDYANIHRRNGCRPLVFPYGFLFRKPLKGRR